MRADNHQLLQPLFVSTLSDKVKYDVERHRPRLQDRRQDRRARTRRCPRPARCSGPSWRRRCADVRARHLLAAERRGLRAAAVHAVERAHAHLQHDGRAQLRAREHLHAGRVLLLADRRAGSGSGRRSWWRRCWCGVARRAGRALRAAPRAPARPRRRDPLHLRARLRDRARSSIMAVGTQSDREPVPAVIDFPAFTLFGTQLSVLQGADDGDLGGDVRVPLSRVQAHARRPRHPGGAHAPAAWWARSATTCRASSCWCSRWAARSRGSRA